MAKLARAEWEPLICGALDGDQDACTCLFTAYSPSLRAVLSKYCAPDDLDDLLQSAWMQIFKKLESFEGTSEFGTWCHTVAVNVALMRYRARKNKPENNAVSFDAPLNDEGTMFIEPEYVDKGFEWAGDSSKLRAMIQELPEGCREIVELKLDGYVISEIAERLGCTSGNIKSQYFRALQKLKSMMTKGTTIMDGVENAVETTPEVATKTTVRTCKCGCGTPIGARGWPYTKGHGKRQVKVQHTRQHAPVARIAETPQTSSTYAVQVTEAQLNRLMLAMPISQKIATVQAYLLGDRQ